MRRVVGLLIILLGCFLARQTYNDPELYLGVKPRMDFWTYLWVHFQIHNIHYLPAILLTLLGFCVLTWKRKNEIGLQEQTRNRGSAD